MSQYVNAEKTLIRTDTPQVKSLIISAQSHPDLWEMAVSAGVDAFQAPPFALPDLLPYQFRAILKLSGKQEALYAVVEALAEPQRTVAQSKLEYSLTFRRDNDLVALAKEALGLSDAELDELWLQAASIT